MENFTTMPEYFLESLNTSAFSESGAQRTVLFTSTEAIALSVVVGLLAAFGIVGNSLTFLAIATSSKLAASPFNIMIMSLCVSDLLSATDSPFVLYRRTYGYYEYHLPVFFCKTTFAVDFWTTNTTIQHILAFIIMRIAAVKYPHGIKKFTCTKAKILACVIWAETCLVNFVFYMVFPTVYLPHESPTGKACTVQKEMISRLKQYMYYGYPTFLFIPMGAVVLLTIYLVMLIAKRRSDKKTVKNEDVNLSKENFALLQLCLIVASFLFGYIPDIAYRITTISYFLRGDKYHGRGPWQFLMAAHICLRISECLNPIFYNLASSKMRAATREFVSKSCCKFRQKRISASKSTSQLDTVSTKVKNESSKVNGEEAV